MLPAVPIIDTPVYGARPVATSTQMPMNVGEEMYRAEQQQEGAHQHKPTAENEKGRMAYGEAPWPQ